LSSLLAFPLIFPNEVLRFIRCFDRRDHDVASTYREKTIWLKRMHTLFVEGHIMTSTGDAAPGGGPQVYPGTPQTATEIVLRQAMEAGPVFYGNKVLHLWSPEVKAKATRVMEGMHTVVRTMTARIDSELSENSLLQDFCVFDLNVWKHSLHKRQTDPAGWDTFLRAVRKRTGRLVEAYPHEVDKELAIQELVAAGPHLVHHPVVGPQVYPGSPGPGAIDNQQTWLAALGPELPRLVMPSGSFAHLPVIVAWYLSIEDGTCQVERDLGALTRVLVQHMGPLGSSRHTDTLGALLEVHLDGPSNEHEIAERSCALSDQPGGGASGLLLTSFSRRCSQIWLCRHGRRFLSYKKRSDAGKPGRRRPGTDAAVARGQAAAADALCAAAASAQPAHQHASIIGGMARQSFAMNPNQKLSAMTAWNAKLQQFHNNTKRKQATQQALSQRRAQGAEVYPTPAFRRAVLFAKGGASPRPPCIVRRLYVWDSCALPCSEKAPVAGVRYRLLRGARQSDDFLQAMQSVTLVIVDSIDFDLAASGHWS